MHSHPRAHAGSITAAWRGRPNSTGTIAALIIGAAAFGSSAAADERLPQGGNVPVMAHAVLCKPDLLRCRDLGTDRLVFANFSSCREVLPKLRKSLRPIGTLRSEVVLARCRYVLPEAGDTPDPAWRLRVAHAADQSARSTSIHR